MERPWRFSRMHLATTSLALFGSTSAFERYLNNTFVNTRNRCCSVNITARGVVRVIVGCSKVFTGVDGGMAIEMGRRWSCLAMLRADNWDTRWSNMIDSSCWRFFSKCWVIVGSVCVGLHIAVRVCVFSGWLWGCVVLRFMACRAHFVQWRFVFGFRVRSVPYENSMELRQWWMVHSVILRDKILKSLIKIITEYSLVVWSEPQRSVWETPIFNHVWAYSSDNKCKWRRKPKMSITKWKSHFMFRCNVISVNPNKKIRTQLILIQRKNASVFFGPA